MLYPHLLKRELELGFGLLQLVDFTNSAFAHLSDTLEHFYLQLAHLHIS